MPRDIDVMLLDLQMMSDDASTDLGYLVNKVFYSDTKPNEPLHKTQKELQVGDLDDWFNSL